MKKMLLRMFVTDTTRFVLVHLLVLLVASCCFFTASTASEYGHDLSDTHLHGLSTQEMAEPDRFLHASHDQVYTVTLSPPVDEGTPGYAHTDTVTDTSMHTPEDMHVLKDENIIINPNNDSVNSGHIKDYNNNNIEGAPISPSTAAEEASAESAASSHESSITNDIVEEHGSVASIEGFASSTQTPYVDETGQPTGGPVIGIDLGTTFSVVAVIQDGSDGPHILANEKGHRITPSYVSITKDGSFIVGEAAKALAATDPRNTIYNIKRLMGVEYHPDMAKEFTYQVKRHPTNKELVHICVPATPHKCYTPIEISTQILKKMKSIAEEKLITNGTEVRDAVITVPALFTDPQRQATKEAAIAAGLNVLRIINEPTAAALAYGLHQENEENVLVYDLGGGTFDVSILNIENGTFMVKQTRGDRKLGGADFDNNIVNYFVELIKSKYHKDISADEKAIATLREKAEQAKRSLTRVSSAQLQIDKFIDGNDFEETLTRSKFEELNSHLFQQTIDVVQKALRDASLKHSEIHEIVLVGGSTRIPKIRQLIKDLFNGKTLHTKIDADEAVALGAAVQAGMITNRMPNDMLLVDIAPLSIGIETVGGVMDTIIKRNTAIPVGMTKIYSTVYDNQTHATLKVYQGERTLTQDNTHLSTIELSGIHPGPKGVPHIAVTIFIDLSGIIHVAAEDKGTGKTVKITITENNRLSSTEVDRLKADAIRNSEADKLAKSRVEARNTLEDYISFIQHQVSEHSKFGANLSEEEAHRVQSALADAKEWLDDENVSMSDLQEGLKELKEVCTPIIQNHIHNIDHTFQRHFDL